MTHLFIHLLYDLSLTHHRGASIHWHLSCAMGHKDRGCAFCGPRHSVQLSKPTKEGSIWMETKRVESGLFVSPWKRHCSLNSFLEVIFHLHLNK